MRERAALSDAERRRPQVTVRQLLVARVEDGVTRYELSLFYEVLYSGIKSLRIDVPEATAAMLRNKTKTIRDQVIDDLFSRERVSGSGDGASEGFLGGLNENLRSMVTHTKYRADARKKLRRIVHQDVELSQEEVEALEETINENFQQLLIEFRRQRDS